MSLDFDAERSSTSQVRVPDRTLDFTDFALELPHAPPPNAPFVALTGSEEGKYIFNESSNYDPYTHYWWLLRDNAKGDYLSVVATESQLNWLQLGNRNQLQLVCIGVYFDSHVEPPPPFDVTWKTLTPEEVVTIQEEMLDSWGPSEPRLSMRLRWLSKASVAQHQLPDGDYFVVELPQDAKDWVMNGRLHQGRRNFVGVLETTSDDQELIRQPTQAEKVLMEHHPMRTRKIC